LCNYFIIPSSFALHFVACKGKQALHIYPRTCCYVSKHVIFIHRIICLIVSYYWHRDFPHLQTWTTQGTTNTLMILCQMNHHICMGCIQMQRLVSLQQLRKLCSAQCSRCNRGTVDQLELLMSHETKRSVEPCTSLRWSVRK